MGSDNGKRNSRRSGRQPERKRVAIPEDASVESASSSEPMDHRRGGNRSSRHHAINDQASASSSQSSVRVNSVLLRNALATKRDKNKSKKERKKSGGSMKLTMLLIVAMIGYVAYYAMTNFTTEEIIAIVTGTELPEEEDGSSETQEKSEDPAPAVEEDPDAGLASLASGSGGSLWDEMLTTSDSANTTAAGATTDKLDNDGSSTTNSTGDGASSESSTMNGESLDNSTVAADGDLTTNTTDASNATSALSLLDQVAQGQVGEGNGQVLQEGQVEGQTMPDGTSNGTQPLADGQSQEALPAADQQQQMQPDGGAAQGKGYQTNDGSDAAVEYDANEIQEQIKIKQDEYESRGNEENQEESGGNLRGSNNPDQTADGGASPMVDPSSGGMVMQDGSGMQQQQPGMEGQSNGMATQDGSGVQQQQQPGMEGQSNGMVMQDGFGRQQQPGVEGQSNGMVMQDGSGMEQQQQPVMEGQSNGMAMQDGSGMQQQQQQPGVEGQSNGMVMQDGSGMQQQQQPGMEGQSNGMVMQDGSGMQQQQQQPSMEGQSNGMAMQDGSGMQQQQQQPGVEGQSNGMVMQDGSGMQQQQQPGMEGQSNGMVMQDGSGMQQQQRPGMEGQSNGMVMQDGSGMQQQQQPGMEGQSNGMVMQDGSGMQQQQQPVMEGQSNGMIMQDGSGMQQQGAEGQSNGMSMQDGSGMQQQENSNGVMMQQNGDGMQQGGAMQQQDSNGMMQQNGGAAMQGNMQSNGMMQQNGDGMQQGGQDGQSMMGGNQVMNNGMVNSNSGGMMTNGGNLMMQQGDNPMMNNNVQMENNGMMQQQGGSNQQVMSPGRLRRRRLQEKKPHVESPYENLSPSELAEYVGNHAKYRNLVNFNEDLPFQPTSQVPYFWHIHKSGGSSMKHMLTSLDLAQTRRGDSEDCRDTSEEIHVCRLVWGSSVNADASNLKGIERIHRLGLVEKNISNLVVTSSRFYEALPIFNQQHRGRLFVIMREPMERAVSKYYYNQIATWERNYNPTIANMTIVEYANSHLCFDNWMTRRLIHKMNPAEKLTEGDLRLAKEVLRQKAMILLMEDYVKSIHRLTQYFGWKVNPHQRWFLDKYTMGNPVNTNPHPVPDHLSPEWAALREKHIMDIELYRYASKLYHEKQALFIYEQFGPANLPDPIDPQIPDS